MGKLPLLEVEIGDYGEAEAAMVHYRRDGEARAAALGNRGPIRFTAEGALDPAIIEAYDRTGFYIFEGVLSRDELEDIERDVIAMLDNAPVTKGAPLDRHGRPALGADGRDRRGGGVKPLPAPVGGTKAVNGRPPAKMIEPEAPDGAPDLVLQIVLGSLQFSPG